MGFGSELARRIALVLLLAAGTASVSARQPGVEAASYPEAARALLARGILTGTTDGDLELTRHVTRAELLTVLHRTAGAPAASRQCFEDVAPEAWYAEAVCWGAATGVTTGYPDGSFRPERDVGLAEALAALLRVRGIEFTAPASPWHAPVLAYAERAGLSTASVAAAPLSRDDLVMLLFQDLRRQARLDGAALPSSGCGVPPEPPPETLLVGGRERSLIVEMPPDYDPDTPRPLIVAFHGRTSPNHQVQRYYRLEPYDSDALFVYPSAIASEGGFRWDDPGDGGDDLRDYELFDAILDRLASGYCLDLDRVFVVGHSLGASFATSLACARGDRIRAVAALGGGVQASGCSGNVAAMILHNPDDRLVPVSEGERARDLFVALNDLEAESVATEPALLGCRRHPPLDTMFPVLWCPHDFDTTSGGRYYPHNWPAPAGAAIMEFFERLP